MQAFTQATPPSNPAFHDVWFNTSTGLLFVWTRLRDGSGTWVEAYVPGMTASMVPMPQIPATVSTFAVTNPDPTVYSGPTPPGSANDCDLWYDNSTGFLFIRYNDGNTIQWVVTTPGRGGAVGPPGPQGDPGTVWRGDWVDDFEYTLRDAVSFEGSSYVSLIIGNLNIEPDSDPLSWQLMAAKGDQGVVGPVGPTGPGVPVGGTTGQYLVKSSNVDFATQWQTLPDFALESDVIAALATKEPTITGGSTGQYWRGDKSFQTLDKAAVGLSNVDNTSDANKPVSTAQAAADALKVAKAGDTMTGTLVWNTGAALTANTPAINISQTWNNGAANFIGIQGNFIVTAAGASAYPIDMQVDSHMGFRMDKFGTTYGWGSHYQGGAGHFDTGWGPAAGGDVNAGLHMSNVSTFGVTYGSGAPNKAFARGSIYLRTDAPAVPYYNTDGAGTGWLPLASTSNTWRLLGDTLLGAAAAFIDFRNLPSDINHLHGEFDITPVTDLQNFILQCYDASDVLLTTNYAWANFAAGNTTATGGAPGVTSSSGTAFSGGFLFNYAQAGAQISNAGVAQGQFSMRNIRASARMKNCVWQMSYSSTSVMFAVTGSGHRNPTLVSGIRCAMGAGNLAAGSRVTIWGAP